MIFVAGSRVQDFGVCRIDCKRRDQAQGVGMSNKIFVRVIGPHDDRCDLAGLRVDKLPGVARIGTAPQSGCLCVHHLGIQRVKDKEPNNSA